MRTLLTLAAMTAAVALAGCGDDDSDPASTPAAVEGADLGAIKDYLLEHAAALKEQPAALAEDAEAYHAAAEAAGFDYGRLLSENRAEVADTVARMQATFREANPAYEEMEGVVAGVPQLADFDVIIDAGGGKADPGNPLPFPI